VDGSAVVAAPPATVSTPAAAARESIGLRRRRQSAERIETTLGPQPLIAGIDLASHTHVAWVRTRTNPMLEAFELAHSLAGVDGLWERLERLRAREGCERVIVGMEPTAHYWKNVIEALARRGGTCVLVNALSVWQDRRTKHLRHAKGDRRDAEIIAGLVARGDFLRSRLETDPRWIAMRILAGEHEDLLDIAGSERQRVRAALGCALPEFLEEFDDPLGETSRAALRALGLPHAEAPGAIEGVIAKLEGPTLRSREGRRIHRSKVRALVARLRSGPSFGVEGHRAPLLARIARSVERYGFCEGWRIETAERLVKLYEELPHARVLDTIPHVSPLQHALLLAYLGDPKRFDRASCLISRAGTEPQENQSGQSAGATPISRSGHGRIREILHRIAMGLRLADPQWRAVYDRLRQRPNKALTDRQALVVLGNKYLRLVYRLCVDERPFDPRRRAQGGSGPRSCRRQRTT
jgi:transposase